MRGLQISRGSLLTDAMDQPNSDRVHISMRQFLIYFHSALLELMLLYEISVAVVVVVVLAKTFRTPVQSLVGFQV
jgi:hypothetical protein